MSRNLPAPTPGTSPAAPYVNVAHDPNTGRVVIALDATAADALHSLLDALPLAHDMALDMGFTDDTADRVSATVGPLRYALSRILGF